jgi:RadC-like JAB domain
VLCAVARRADGKRVSEVSRFIDIKMLDHVIMGTPAGGRSGYFSFKEAGLLSSSRTRHVDKFFRLWSTFSLVLTILHCLGFYAP